MHNVAPTPYAPEVRLRYEAATELQHWLETIPFTHYVTFNFNRPTTPKSGRRALKRWHAKLDRELYGRRFVDLPASERTLFVAFPEHVASNLHYHALLRTNADEFNAIAPRIWKRVVPSGDLFNSDCSDNTEGALHLLAEQAPTLISRGSTLSSWPICSS